MDEETTARILTHTLRALMTEGYAGLRIERIAAAAGCAKTTLYRRWPNRAQLVVDALAPFLQPGSEPDTGNVVDDLLQFTLQNNRNQTQREIPGRTSQRLWGVLVEPDVHELLTVGYMASRRAMGTAILRRAIERGELPSDIDVDTILDALAGFTFFRNAVRAMPADERTHRSLVVALVTSPPRVAS
ncbi:DNA-binding transcriptional regulator, AcrR family [Propionibacterium cyclohexanicum]|uniref:DNA-binding transcriptional regulator, AcrR family n=1 Tax=Propionibacterium cyclohexanicum TaxID=64702 RepID=A0A1H9PFK7_9ACTN|nr:TetR/AcrR family transcriptional regulator [Propionibacterium cyclohexanicum]SER46982.1 DNA-binding transcriptional regulator, AcrR family [Propionibacterium cyclohexanicum]